MPGLHKTASEEGKTALAGEFTDALKAAAPYIFATGAIGLTVAAARKMGGVAGQMMQERQLNESFNIMSKRDPEIRQIPNARSYYDVIARHSPSIAMDPVVAPGIIKQMDQFGGVDLNTVGKLREIENRGPITQSSLDVANTMLTSTRTLQGLDNKLETDKIRSEIDRNNMQAWDIRNKKPKLSGKIIPNAIP
jgi:hypothetical protein